MHDQALLDRPGNAEIQLDLFYDYRTNLPLYPKVQAFFREHRPPTLVVWGKNDKIFPAEGAHPYKRDLPDVEFHLLDTGHFALEDKLDEMVPLIRDFLARNVDKKRCAHRQSIRDIVSGKFAMSERRNTSRATSRSPESVKAVQARKGSRRGYASRRCAAGGQTRITPDLAAFIESQISVFLGTANDDGQPYIQHRGGPPGFLKVLDDKTIGFADFSGNKQYITLGNLADNPKAILFLIDYQARQRVKIWGEARVVEGDAELIAKLMPEGYRARPEQAILFTVSAWDANCPQHIPQRFEAADVAAALADRDARIADLEAEACAAARRRFGADSFSSTLSVVSNCSSRPNNRPDRCRAS